MSVKLSRFALLCVLALLMLGTGLARAAVYKCVDAQGAVQFQQVPCPSRSSDIHPLQVSEITKENALQTMDLFGQAAIKNDIRAQLEFYADDFEYATYSSNTFQYPNLKLDKARMADILSAVNGLAVRLVRGNPDAQVEMLEQPAPNTFLIHLQSKTNNSLDSFQRIEFIIQDGRMLFRHWGVAK